MADSDEKKEEIPAFKFSEKKVDDSWKEEARKEREAAAKAAAPHRVPPAPAAPPAAAPTSASVTNVAPKGTVGEALPPETSAEKAQSPLEQQQTKIFLNFIDGLAQQALMQLGELENPYTGQAEMDLQGARYTIELLSVVMTKTKGNLTETENKALTGVLQDLRTHFAAIAQEVQRQMQAQAARGGVKRPGPGGTIG